MNQCRMISKMFLLFLLGGPILDSQLKIGILMVQLYNTPSRKNHVDIYWSFNFNHSILFHTKFYVKGISIGSGWTVTSLLERVNVCPMAFHLLRTKFLVVPSSFKHTALSSLWASMSVLNIPTPRFIEMIFSFSASFGGKLRLVPSWCWWSCFVKHSACDFSLSQLFYFSFFVTNF